MNKKILFFVWVILGLYSCEDVFEPSLENNRDLESTHDDPRFTAGLLYNAYNRLPTNGWSFSEMATDDAVSNNVNHVYIDVATGQWAPNFDPLSQWQNSKAAIQYINLVLSEVDSVTFAEDSLLNVIFKERTKGEAYGLRALFNYHLLQAHGGWAGDELLGTPITEEPENKDSKFDIPRASFEENMQHIYSDIEKAINFLPLDYGNVADASEIPQEYLDRGVDKSLYERAFGNETKGRLTERIARAIRAKAALMAASPRFSDGNTTTWADAANYAAEVLDLKGGVAGLDPNGGTWFSNAGVIDGLGSGNNPNEILWRGNLQGSSSNLEAQNFPPSLFGDGLVNPTQNFVDAFPMANGYPLANPNANYDPFNPYLNRDPRLLQFVVVNGSELGVNNSIIYTAADATTDDGLNKKETSTRTGYYLRKLLREDVSLNPGSVNGQRHVKPHIRYTELFLIYAEAANEAWGPIGTGGNAYSAYDVIKAIRQRAGVGVDNGDAYLESVKNDQEAMRKLIRNERRLELSFEGFRFWDLRRWEAELTEAAKGVRIINNNPNVFEVEPRIYAPHMIYGPVPYSEVLKFGFEQNSNW